MTFKIIKPTDIPDNVFKLIGRDWMLVTAGTIDKYNTMTASWGGFGHLWNRDICWCVVRPQRYTFGFMEQADRFTLSFFTEEYRDALKFCGTKSGRDHDKATETGLTPFSTESGAVSFEQARLVLECRKDYIQDLDPRGFLDPKIHSEYPNKDYHRMYLGEIERCLMREA
ncbi:MAG TPA: flavin reductase [candidate division Zixibacteria bacterium]|nr:flavin reductase [candidate division Zixibacteria bacterium]